MIPPLFSGKLDAIDLLLLFCVYSLCRRPGINILHFMLIVEKQKSFNDWIEEDPVYHVEVPGSPQWEPISIQS